MPMDSWLKHSMNEGINDQKRAVLLVCHAVLTQYTKMRNLYIKSKVGTQAPGKPISKAQVRFCGKAQTAFNSAFRDTLLLF